MRVDVATLQRFYAAPLGRVAQRMAARRLASLWAHADGRDVLGLGYAAPYLDRFRAGARRVALAMPAAQGAHAWPSGARGLACLADETRLPFMDALFDRVLIVHALEEADSARALLREVWRVMAPEGRLVVIVANRAGLWARAEHTPFGHGRPYSRGQLATLLSDGMFEPAARARALYLPPVRWLSRLAYPFERAGGVLWSPFGGLLLMEAVKRLTATPSAPARRRVGAPQSARAT
ncbi:MAG: methyltransferase domain-containing protein [Alphaproteobacteria bacterium]|nr:methyltransferase domain-containing protein [Alphaproteobacteria bacterium]